MNTLIINGSPRSEGNTFFLTGELKKRLKGKVTEIKAYDMKFNPCTDCRACINGGCIYSDDMTELIGNIDSFDNIVIATPLYYNQPTGVLMSLMSRNQIIFNQSISLKPKTGAIIVTGGGDTVVNSADAEKTLRIMLRSYNTTVRAYARSLHTGKTPACEDEAAIDEIQKMSNILNECLN